MIAEQLQQDEKGNDETLLHLEIGLPRHDRSLRILRVNNAAVTVKSLQELLTDHLLSLAAGPNAEPA
jgi:hypothetical protein